MGKKSRAKKLRQIAREYARKYSKDETRAMFELLYEMSLMSRIFYAIRVVACGKNRNIVYIWLLVLSFAGGWVLVAMLMMRGML
jgi:hypothetical protein